MSILSGYRIMWLMVLFDLPVVKDNERKEANRFRLFLLDLGFEMAQFSVYIRHTSGKEAIENYRKRIESQLPSGGKVDMLQFTDKQYENIVSFRGATREPGKKTLPN